MRLPAQPGLYKADADVPVLCGTRCSECGRISFPALSIGCDICGATEDKLEPIDLPTTGVVHSFAKVCSHRGQPVEPFIVAEIRLDSGLLIRAVTSEGSSPPRIGDQVAATWAVTRVDDSGNDVAEPVFAVVTA